MPGFFGNRSISVTEFTEACNTGWERSRCCDWTKLRVTLWAEAAKQQVARVKDREMEWAEWMRRGLAGDEASYRRLLEALAPALRAIVRSAASRYRLPAADIEDIVQETLLAVHLKRQTWKETEPLTPWLRAIARNKLIDVLRRRGRGGRIDVPIDRMAETLAAPETEAQLSPRETNRVLSAINGRQRDVVRAIAVEGLTAAETAARLGVSEGAVRVALHRGLAAIAAAFRTEE